MSQENDNTKEIEVGGELDLEIEFEGGQLVFSLKHEGKLGFAEFKVGSDAVKVVDKITDLIPGDWDDALIDNAVAKLLAKKTGGQVE